MTHSLALPGRLSLPGMVRPQVARRTRTATAPPTFDIGHDLLGTEGAAVEPARLTVVRQSADDVGYREVYVALDGESVAMLE